MGMMRPATDGMNMQTGEFRYPAGRPGTASRQRGAVLFVTLIVLVAMTLAAIATVRQIDATTQVAGNLAFRQSTTLGADAAIETARNWLLAPAQTAGTALFADSAPGYFSSTPTTGPGLETPWSAYDWTNQSLAAGTDTAGNTLRYVIHRMCNQPGDPNGIGTGISCLTSLTTNTIGSGKGAGRVGVQGSSLYYYRITIRVTGPRNTVSYVQTMIEL
jgi:Tfp pilus assembly protein PilX